MPVSRFDLCGPLPGPGITVVEASAGTGKTFTVAGLLVRFVAEGAAKLSEILAVTFTRAATGELKERVRSRLASAELALAQLIRTGAAPPEEDELLCLLAKPAFGPVKTSAGTVASAGGKTPAGASKDAPSELGLRHRRLSEALSSFDSATIATTHGFCYMVLSALGVWGEFSPGAVLLEDPRDLVQEVVDDLYARWVARHGALPFSPQEALAIGLAAVGNLGTEIEPAPYEADVTPRALRRRLAIGARAEVSRRLLEANLLTYDGMLVRLRDALASPERGEGARRRLAARYRVVLVDEFQDTDFVQWEVVSRAFCQAGVRVVLVGDPKQAIYAFRGADVHAYLAAARVAGEASRFTLDRNWRFDRRLAEACDALFYPLQLGHPEIVYRPAAGSCQQQGPRLVDAPVEVPLRLRWMDRSALHQRNTQRAVPKARAVNLVANDLATDVAGLLASRARLLGCAASNQAATARELEAADVAVLVRTNDQATTVQSALLAAGVPAVVSSARSVMSTLGAHDWLVLLDALQEPAAHSPAAGAALSDFFGMRAEELGSGDERLWEAVHERLHEWSSVLRRSGVAALFAEVCASEALPRRLLSEVQGERRLTDLAHIAELLHAEARRSQLGPPALRAWLARRIDEARNDKNEDEELCRRLDSDAEAVQILTVHRAKGLEFPVVYCPYLWDTGKRPELGAPVTFHEPDGTRKLDVGEACEPSYKAHFELFQDELQGEDLRQMYVALSRAKHQLVLWWAPATNCQRSPLGRVLLSRRQPSGALEPPRSSAPRDNEVAAALEELAARSPQVISVEKVEPRAATRWVPPVRTGQPGQLSVMPFGRELDTAWGRLSYSSITAKSYGPRGEALTGGGDLVGSEPEDPGTADEPPPAAPGAPSAGSRLVAGHVGPAPGPDADFGGATGSSQQLGRPASLESDLRSIVSSWSALPTGAGFGTFVHSVLQLVDFSAPELSSALKEAVAACSAAYPGDPAGFEALLSGLEAAITTPLGPLVGGISLRDVKRADRLDELSFELPLAGGERPAGRLTTADLAVVLSRHLGAHDPVGSYAVALRDQSLDTTLRGYLNGSLDLVFRTQSSGEERYFLVDYKTNWLAPAGEPLTAWHYRPAALHLEMRHANYVLQALFYLVALHRYLRWRVRGYTPEAHLGGVLYLFVRGMHGPGGPVVDGQPCGVFSWAPPAALVSDMSELLAGTGGPGETLGAARNATVP